MIHGHGSHSDWTAGCIAVDDDIMDILYRSIVGWERLSLLSHKKYQ